MPNQITHPWTKEEILFLEKHIHKLTYKEMSKQINRSPTSIQSKIRYLPFQQKVKKYSVNYDFFKKWSPEMAYVLGFIAADGNICHSGRSHALHIACDDKDVIHKIRVVINYEGPVHKKSRLNGKISYSLRICDQIIFQDLERLGVTERKSLTFTPPRIPRNLVRHFIRGYFDGDGSVSLRNHSYHSRLIIRFYSGSLSMAQYLHNIMIQEMGKIYNGSILVHMAHKKAPFYVVHLGHKGAVKIFDYFYRDSSIFLERKYNKFLEGMNYVT